MRPRRDGPAGENTDAGDSRGLLSLRPERRDDHDCGDGDDQQRDSSPDHHHIDPPNPPRF
jgi:hypothetical protein